MNDKNDNSDRSINSGGVLNVASGAFGFIAVVCLLLLLINSINPLRDSICDDLYCFEIVDVRQLISLASLSGVISIGVAARGQIAGLAVGVLLVFLGVIAAIAAWPEFRFSLATTQYSADEVFRRKLQSVVFGATSITPEQVVDFNEKLKLTDGAAAMKFTLAEPMKLKFALKIPADDRVSSGLIADPQFELYLEERSTGRLRRTLLFYDDNSGELSNDAAIVGELEANNCEGGNCQNNYLILARDLASSEVVGILANASEFELSIEKFDWADEFEADEIILLSGDQKQLSIPSVQHDSNIHRYLVQAETESDSSCLKIDVDPATDESDSNNALVVLDENEEFLGSNRRRSPGSRGATVSFEIEPSNKRQSFFAEVYSFGESDSYTIQASLSASCTPISQL